MRSPKEGNVVRMVLTLGVILLLASTSRAAISVVAEPRTDLLYSTAEIDCTELHATASDALPFNVVRLRAMNNGAPVDSSVRLQWSFRGKALGTLAADLDLGPAGALPNVTAMCADFGNACVLSNTTLASYEEPTILYVAPSCGDLSRDPSKPFSGGSARIRVKAFNGKKKIGKADVTIGYGRVGSATLLVRNTAGDFANGLGRDTGVVTFVDTVYAANVDEPAGQSGPPTSYQVSGDLGSLNLGGPCAGFEACGSILQTGQRGTMLLTATYADKSALCDNIRVVVAVCSPDVQGELQVTPSPKRTTYDPANPAQAHVDVTVRLKNNSQAQGDLKACNFLLQGPGVLTCTSKLKAGAFTDTKTTTFSLPHCSGTEGQGCTTDADCRPPACTSCMPDERCLSMPYCSATTSQGCTTDADCAPPACPTCEGEQLCIYMLHPVDDPSIFITPGHSALLLQGTAALRNHFKKNAALTDTWTAIVTVPSFSVKKTLKYKIRSRP